MPRLINADDLLMDNSWTFYDENGNRNEACIAVENAPTVDAVEVVRCKDCEVCEVRQTANYLPFLYCQFNGHSVSQNTFCCWGKRKEDTETNGHWYKQGDEYRCSRCGDTSIVGFKICPNCGAKMNEIKNDR